MKEVLVVEAIRDGDRHSARGKLLEGWTRGDPGTVREHSYRDCTLLPGSVSTVLCVLANEREREPEYGTGFCNRVGPEFCVRELRVS